MPFDVFSDLNSEYPLFFFVFHEMNHSDSRLKAPHFLWIVFFVGHFGVSGVKDPVAFDDGASHSLPYDSSGYVFYVCLELLDGFLYVLGGFFFHCFISLALWPFFFQLNSMPGEKSMSCLKSFWF